MDLRRLPTEREIVDPVLFLLSDQAKYVTGTALPAASGTMPMLPRARPVPAVVGAVNVTPAGAVVSVAMLAPCEAEPLATGPTGSTPIAATAPPAVSAEMNTTAPS